MKEIKVLYDPDDINKFWYTLGENVSYSEAIVMMSRVIADIVRNPDLEESLLELTTMYCNR